VLHQDFTKVFKANILSNLQRHPEVCATAACEGELSLPAWQAKGMLLHHLRFKATVGDAPVSDFPSALQL
jgi:hypothetical protein